MKRAVSLILAGSLALSLAACGGSASSTSTTASSAAGTTLTGKGDGFGGVITATVTMEGDTITAVSFDAPDETESVGGAALSTLAEQIVAANGTEIDGVSGATYTTNGCKAAVLNALDPEANPYEETTETTLFDYCATEEGGQWYLDATDGKDCYLLTSDEAASSADAANVAATYSMQYKEGDGHGTAFWSSPITFPGNMQLLKEFAEQTNFSYDYYADGGLTQNADGYWQTADAVSGATIAEGCTYLDMLKTLYDRIQNGEYEKAV